MLLNCTHRLNSGNKIVEIRIIGLKDVFSQNWPKLH